MITGRTNAFIALHVACVTKHIVLLYWRVLGCTGTHNNNIVNMNIKCNNKQPINHKEVTK